MHPSSEHEGAAVEMPRYRSHKEVWALKIKSCSRPSSDDRGAMLVKLAFHDAGYADTFVPIDVINRYTPQDGDYYVVYDDGYKSISPAKAFEEGYTRVVRIGPKGADPAEPRPR